MDFGKAHSKIDGLWKNLDNVIQNLEILTREPENYIEDYFQKLINQIDLRREENKLVIDKWHEERLEEVLKYKNVFLAKLNKQPLKQNQMIQEFKKNLQLWEEKKIIPDLCLNEFSFEKIEKKLKSSVEILNKQINEYKENLLSGNKYELGDKKSIVQDLGQIKIQKMVKSSFYSFLIFLLIRHFMKSSKMFP